MTWQVPYTGAGVRVEGVAFGNGIDGAVDAVEVSADQGALLGLHIIARLMSCTTSIL